jgi:signal transduction histidine kinase
MLDDLGLLPALLWLFDRYTGQTGVRVNFEHEGLEQRVPEELETAAYRMVQEALTNVARHAGVSEVMVRASKAAGVLRLHVVDHGAGFDCNGALSARLTGGLAGMRERAVLLGGRMMVESAPGAGTRLSAEFPLHESQSRGGRRSTVESRRIP